FGSTNKKQVFQDLPDPRRAILQLVLEILTNSNDDVLDEFHQFLNVTLINGLLEHPSSHTRTILLKILYLYISRRPQIKELFLKKYDGVSLLAKQLSKFKPSLMELQVLL